MTTMLPHLRPRQPECMFFILESVLLRRYIESQYAHVIQSPVIPQHVAYARVGKRQAVIETVQDWLLFSFCQYYVLANSGFSKTAAAYSKVRKAIFRHPRFMRSSGRCDGRTPYSLEALGTTWSGL